MLFMVLPILTRVDVSAQCNPSVFSSPPRYAADRQSRSVAVAEFNGDGKLDLAVANLLSNDVSILLGDGFGGFGPPTHVPVNPEPSVVAAGDFNKDGKTDLAVGYGFFRPVSVLLGNGDGTFSGPTSIGNSSNTSHLAVADFNNDGNPDIAVASAEAQMILLGNGSGGFTTNEILVGSGATSVAAGDINGDGIQDAAFTADGSGNWKVALVLGNAAGTFSLNASVTLDQAPTGIAIGNFNGDSQPDLLLTVNWFEPRVMLFLNQGNNNFTLSTQFFAGREPHDVTAGDFNGDGKLDAAAALTGAHGVAIALGNGLGGFSAPTFFGAGTQPWSIGSGDFNADGKFDLVTSDDPNIEVAPPVATGGVSVLLGTGTGTFQSYRSYVYPFTPQFVLSPTSIAAADFNNNNRTDLALSFSSTPFIAVMLDDGQGEFIQPSSFLDAGGSVASIAVSDLNGDGKADVVSANSNTNNLSIFFGVGNGSFMPRVQIAVNSNPRFVGIGDFNGDSKPDLIVTHENPDTTLVLLGEGSGSFTQLGGSPQPVLHDIAIGDFNGDGRSDIVAGNSPTNNVAIFLADATGHLNLASTTPSLSINTEMRLQTADLNADNKLDVVVANANRNTITVFLGNGMGALSAGTNFDAGPSPLAPTIADFDGDGTLDVVVANNLSSISFYSGNGAGGLNARVSYSAGAFPNGLAKGDFNQDNKTDLAVLTGTSFGLSILKNVTAPLPCLSVNDVTVTEGDTGSTNLDLAITLSQASAETVRVNYSLVNETATKGADFANLSSRLTFAPGETTKTVSVPVFGDLLNEANETFLLQLSSASGANISDGEGRGTILDNDPLPSISINDISNTEANLTNFTVTLSAVSGRDVKVDFATANGTATAGVSGINDYLATSSTLTIPAGQSSGQISVMVFEDDTFEPDETYFVNLSNPVNATISDAQGQSTIVNNDPVPSVDIQDAFVVEGNSGNTELLFTVFLSNSTFLPVTVNFATANDTAIAGSDYVATSGQVVFGPGEIQKTVAVPVIGDTVDETAETFFLDILNAQNATVGRSRALAFIFDDDGPSISINDVTVAEGNSGTRSATFTLSLSAPSVENIFVRATTAPGTATAASDYNNLNLNITIPAGTVTRTFNVTIRGDTNPEPDETFVVNLSDVSGATLEDAQGLGTIIDDETLRLSLEQSAPNPLQLVAFDSLLFVKDPFHVRSVSAWVNSLPDPNTRLLIFAAGLQLNAGEPASAVVVNLIDSNNQSFDVPAEDVRAMATSGFTQVVFRLPDGLAPGVCKVAIKAHSQTSNVGNITIAP